MADAKISALVDGTTPDDADDFVVARAGSTLKLTWAALKAAIGGSTPYTAHVIGPYTVNFDTPGALVYPGAALFAMSPGDWLIDAWVQVIAQFQGPTLTQVLLGLSSDGANPNDFAGGGIDLVNPHESLTTDFKIEGNAASDATQRLTASRASEAFRRLVPAQARVTCNVCANVYVDDGGLTEGQALISAVVARA